MHIKWFSSDQDERLMGFYMHSGKKMNLEISAAAGKCSSACPDSSGAKKQIFLCSIV